MSLRRRIEQLERAFGNRCRTTYIGPAIARFAAADASGKFGDLALNAISNPDDPILDAKFNEFMALAESSATELPPHLAEIGIDLGAWRAFVADVEGLHCAE